MLEPYESPTITEVGTVAELTLANLFGTDSDNLTWILPILGQDPTS